MILVKVTRLGGTKKIIIRVINKANKNHCTTQRGEGL